MSRHTLADVPMASVWASASAPGVCGTIAGPASGFRVSEPAGKPWHSPRRVSAYHVRARICTRHLFMWLLYFLQLGFTLLSELHRSRQFYKTQKIMRLPVPPPHIYGIHWALQRPRDARAHTLGLEPRKPHPCDRHGIKGYATCRAHIIRHVIKTGVRLLRNYHTPSFLSLAFVSAYDRFRPLVSFSETVLAGEIGIEPTTDGFCRPSRRLGTCTPIKLPPPGLEPGPCGVDNAVSGQRFLALPSSPPLFPLSYNGISPPQPLKQPGRAGKEIFLILFFFHHSRTKRTKRTKPKSSQIVFKYPVILHSQSVG